MDEVAAAVREEYPYPSAHPLEQASVRPVEPQEVVFLEPHSSVPPPPDA